jgi:hypothetical protein
MLLVRRPTATTGFLENGERNAHILTLKAIADVLTVDVKDFI